MKSFILIAFLAVAFAGVSYNNDRDSYDTKSTDKASVRSSRGSIDKFTDRFIDRFTGRSNDKSNDKSIDKSSDKSNDKDTYANDKSNDRRSNNQKSVDKSSDKKSEDSSSSDDSNDGFKIIVKSTNSNDKSNDKSSDRSRSKSSNANGNNKNSNNAYDKSKSSSSSSSSDSDDKNKGKSNDKSSDKSSDRNSNSKSRDSTKNDRSNGNKNSNDGYDKSSSSDSRDSNKKSSGKSNGNSNRKSNANSYSNSKNDCDDISSKDNEIFGDELCGTLVSKYDGSKYDEARQQYSTLNEDGNIRTSPNYILTPDPKCDDDDLKLALKYAKQCNYKVGIRSGGHQYNGLSSCDYKDNKCIQIDMAKYDNCEVLDTNIRPSKSKSKSSSDSKGNNGYNTRSKNENNAKDSRSKDRNGYGYSSNYKSESYDKNDKEYRYTIIEAGPGLAVDDLWTFLKKNDIFFPTDARTSLGAQIVSGGSGNLLRFGTAADYVIGFEIVLADGEKYLIENPDFADEYDYFGDGYKSKYGDSYKKNDELYAAVLGGGPGSFGVITNIYLKTLCDYDFTDNIFWKLEWDYTPSLFKKVGYQFTDLLNSDYYRNDPNKYIGLDVTEETVTYYGWWIKIDNDKKYKFNDNIIEDFRKIGDPKVKVPLTFENSIPYNHINYGMCDEDDWQWEQPMLNQKQYAYNELDYDVIDIINDKVSYICDNPKLGIRLSPGSLRITDEKSSHSYACREDKDVTAQQNRGTEFAVFVETLQYDEKMNKYSQDHAIDLIDELFRKLMKTDAFDDEDIRRVGFTNSYDKFSMEKEWDYYFESQSEYNKVRYVKREVDEKEMFNANDFAIPAFKENGIGNINL